MSEQQYRVHACNNAETHEAHEFRGTYRKPNLPGVEITETFQCQGIERPVPTADEPLTNRLAELQRPVIGHRPYCLSNQPGDWTCNCDMGQQPPLPTREQIAEAMRPEIATYKAVAHGSDEALYTADSDMPERIADAVLALLQKGADRG